MKLHTLSTVIVTAALSLVIAKPALSEGPIRLPFLLESKSENTRLQFSGATDGGVHVVYGGRVADTTTNRVYGRSIKFWSRGTTYTPTFTSYEGSLFETGYGETCRGLVTVYVYKTGAIKMKTEYNDYYRSHNCSVLGDTYITQMKPTTFPIPGGGIL